MVSTNTFSKAWRMTGWRMGWMVLPKSLTQSMGVLVDYNTSCVPDFVQAWARSRNDGESLVSPSCAPNWRRPATR